MGIGTVWRIFQESIGDSLIRNFRDRSTASFHLNAPNTKAPIKTNQMAK